MRKSAKRTVRDPRGWIAKRVGLREDQLCDLGIAYRVSLEAMLKGHGTEESWNTVTCALNIMLVLCESGRMPDAIGECNRALQAQIECKERSRTTGRWIYTGPEMNAVKAAFLAHDDQLSMISVQTLRDALEEVWRRNTVGEQ